MSEHSIRAPAVVNRLRAAVYALPGSTQAFELRRRDRQRAGSVLAAGLAARTFLMLLPLAFILTAVVGFVDQTFPDFSIREMRAAGLTANLVRVVSQSEADARRGRWVLLIIGAVLLVYAAHSLYRALFMTHLVAWGMTAAETSRASIFITSLLVILLPIVSALASFARDLPLPVLALVGVPAGIVLYSGLWLLISRMLPRRADRWTALLPGAAVWGVGVAVLQLLVIFVLPNRVGHASELYGTLAVASSTMAWLFILGRLIVGAATLNAVLWDRSRKAPTIPGK